MGSLTSLSLWSLPWCPCSIHLHRQIVSGYIWSRVSVHRAMNNLWWTIYTCAPFVWQVSTVTAQLSYVYIKNCTLLPTNPRQIFGMFWVGQLCGSVAASTACTTSLPRRLFVPGNLPGPELRIMDFIPPHAYIWSRGQMLSGSKVVPCENPATVEILVFMFVRRWWNFCFFWWVVSYFPHLSSWAHHRHVLRNLNTVAGITPVGIQVSIVSVSLVRLFRGSQLFTLNGHFSGWLLRLQAFELIWNGPLCHFWVSRFLFCSLQKATKPSARRFSGEPRQVLGSQFSH